ncbi:DNA-directed RNA polymerase I subunit RPA49 [Hyphodiscus hymeniophilus]|uniref:DNA-directed RNA polymerase I subunit RPA49 n=1 Tax=Hyphodiscus hymeniophilus TaxID=353542 RepID=A0A9P6VIF7_9HELO|nr:DNA-directed RNA polymerase I subunit RPA49 [Hyphodiscus hymeniophilus]
MAHTVEKSKKRKQNIDGSSRPSKKVALEDAGQIKISLQIQDQWAPIIASTPGVSFPSSVLLKPYTKARENVQKKARGVLATTEVILHSNAHPKLEYTARQQQEISGPDALLKHYVGVYDPSTGKLEVMEARKMVIRGVVRAHQATEEEQFSKNMREQRSDLGRAFGTKKAKKALASITENAISRGGSAAGKADAATQAMIAAMAKDAEGMATRAELAAEADSSKPRPKANLDAKDINDVYTVDNLMGKDIMKAVPVLQWQTALKADKEIVVSSEYVARRIKKVSASADKLKMLRYLLLLIEIHKGSKVKGRGTTKMLPKREELKKIAGGLPEPVIENARRQFSSDGTMDKYHNDLLTTHICAIACLVDNYVLDMYDLQSDLGLDTKVMSQYFNEIGAKTTALPEQYRKDLGLDKAAAAQRRMVKLRLPLEFPKVSFARAPRR